MADKQVAAQGGLTIKRILTVLCALVTLTLVGCTEETTSVVQTTTHTEKPDSSDESPAGIAESFTENILTSTQLQERRSADLQYLTVYLTSISQIPVQWKNIDNLHVFETKTAIYKNAAYSFNWCVDDYQSEVMHSLTDAKKHEVAYQIKPSICYSDTNTLVELLVSHLETYGIKSVKQKDLYLFKNIFVDCPSTLFIGSISDTIVIGVTDYNTVKEVSLVGLISTYNYAH